MSDCKGKCLRDDFSPGPLVEYRYFVNIGTDL
ncbi:hypothetical protein RB2501_12282 [Robiginitalea biformata HTCC2501]|uniref:Uncharacterized protein n=1 Tax=Robiginitalea biformata (strain ATCC BAA-864 / DSM 15991 / KCTC 12146 / HTCC2501) TaxID=313596 RepID=A4CN63_ROBBH|nr:hypothetical protein RB2501_12282 [Robiginitalea biformata HTCC2501]